MGFALTLLCRVIFIVLMEKERHDPESTFCSDGAVYLHYNSIRYRFRLIQRETGLNPRNFYDLEKLLAMIDKQGT